MITEFRKCGSNDGSSSLAANDWIPYPKVALCPLERTAPTARLGPFVEADAGHIWQAPKAERGLRSDQGTKHADPGDLVCPS